MPAVDFEKATEEVEEKVGHPITHTDLMSYLMYPGVFTGYDRARQTYSDVSVLPTPQFYYGMEKGEETVVELEPGKALVVRFLTIGEPHPEGDRTVFFELNGQPREVTIRDKSLQVQTESRVKADPAVPGQVGAPIPGAVTSIVVNVGDTVKKGDRLLVMEAMKMQTTVYAPVAGAVKEKHCNVGQTVDAKDLLMVIG